jgi:hypothetical protein
MFKYLFAFVRRPAAYFGVIEKALHITFNKNSKHDIVSEGLFSISISPISIAPSV